MKRIIFLTGKVFIWMLLLGIVLEIGLRPFGYGSYVIYRPDERLLWLPDPGRKVTVVNHQPITISADGFRYPAKLGPKESSEVRIFAFGDSVTMGWAVDDNSHYSAILERLLNAAAGSHTRYRVVSAGVNAYSNALVAERLGQVIESNFRPDIVILAYSFNTGFEGLARLQGADRQKLLRRVALKSYVRRSALYNFVIEDLLRRLVYYHLRDWLLNGSWDTAVSASAPNLPAFVAGLKQSEQLCRSRNIQLVLLLLSSRDQGFDLHPFQKAMLEFARTDQVPLVNMIDLMGSPRGEKYFLDHVHPTPAGHALIAEQLVQTIRELVPAGPELSAGTTAPQIAREAAMQIICKERVRVR